MKHTLIKLTWS